MSRIRWDDSKYLQTKKGLILRLFYDQCRNSKSRKHNKPEYSRNEFLEWMMMSEEFLEVYDKWVASEYDGELRPSCDRLNNCIGYSFDNIEVVSWQENKRRYYNDACNREIYVGHKTVYQYATDGSFIRSFISQSEAARQIGVKDGQKNISACCNGKVSYVYGYIWRHVYLGYKIKAVDVTNDLSSGDLYVYNPQNGEILAIMDISDAHKNKRERATLAQALSHGNVMYKGLYQSQKYLSPNDVLSKLGSKRVRKFILLDGIHVTSALSASKIVGKNTSTILRLCKNGGGLLNSHSVRYATYEEYFSAIWQSPGQDLR